jgi:hypothetical protein
VVAPEEEEVFLEFDLVAKQEHHAFDGIFAPVDVVADEKVVRVAGPAAVLEDLEEINILAVDVALVRKSVPQTLRGA